MTTLALHHLPHHDPYSPSTTASCLSPGHLSPQTQEQYRRNLPRTPILEDEDERIPGLKALSTDVPLVISVARATAKFDQDNTNTNTNTAIQKAPTSPRTVTAPLEGEPQPHNNNNNNNNNNNTAESPATIPTTTTIAMQKRTKPRRQSGKRFSGPMSPQREITVRANMRLLMMRTESDRRILRNTLERKLLQTSRVDAAAAPPTLPVRCKSNGSAE